MANSFIREKQPVNQEHKVPFLIYLIGSIVFELFFPVKTFDPTFSFPSKVAFGVIGFLFFRFFDIVKLEPAKYLDGKNSGFGIMMDDIAAGLYAGIFTPVATHFIW